MTFIRLNPTRYPYSVAQLRADEPQLSLSAELPDRELASLATLNPPILVARVQPTPRPADTRDQRAEEGQPEQDAAGTWRQTWTMRPATADELAAWDAAHAPAPDWLGFAGWLYQFPAIASAMTAARLSTDPQGEPATTGLPASMDEARLRQNYVAFAQTWGQFLMASHMASADLAEIVGKALACNLPAEFVAALQPLPPTP